MVQAKKLFRIPCMWQMAGEMQIEAETLEQAMRIAEEDALLPTDGEYLVGTFQVDHDSELLGDVIEENGVRVTNEDAVCPKCQSVYSCDNWTKYTAEWEQAEMHEIGHLSVYAGKSDDHSYICPNCGETVTAKEIQIKKG
jgi:RNA polymerase subunit RPABC4/transcription elongation factor Spt4